MTKGQVLARVESPELKSRLLQERSTLESLQSALERQKIDARQDAIKNAHAIDLLEVRLTAARRLLERAQTAFDEGILNKTDYEKAKDDVRIAELELKNAQETAKLADRDGRLRHPEPPARARAPGLRRRRAAAAGGRPHDRRALRRRSSLRSPCRTATRWPPTRRS